MYLDAKNLYGWEMSQKLKNSTGGYFIEVDVEYSKNLFNLPKDLPFLPERNKIKKM